MAAVIPLLVVDKVRLNPLSAEDQEPAPHRFNPVVLTLGWTILKVTLGQSSRPAQLA